MLAIFSSRQFGFFKLNAPENAKKKALVLKVSKRNTYTNERTLLLVDVKFFVGDQILGANAHRGPGPEAPGQYEDHQRRWGRRA